MDGIGMGTIEERIAILPNPFPTSGHKQGAGTPALDALRIQQLTQVLSID